jgi:asparagine synthase (glutamine-hydrolysing)
MNTFLALWNRIGEPVDETVLRSMLAANDHPGNDGQEFWLQSNVGLAHQHFWVTPEEMGQPQPRQDPENSCVIACSARLDNRQELIHLLGLATETDPHRLSDADLILAAYRRWGTECPRALLGDFAFALWDPGESLFFAARDALGAQELYYSLDQRYFMMATRINILLMHPAVQPKLNQTKIAEFLAVLWGDDTNTFYDSIVHLPPAHCLLVTAGASRLWRYWEIDAGKTIRYTHPEEYAEHYQELIREALLCRLRSAFPVGISLSGGLDSSSLACLAAEIISAEGLPQESLKTYSYVFYKFHSCDERSYIQPVIEQAARFHPIQPRLVEGDAFWPTPLNEDWLIQRDYPFQDPYYNLLRGIQQTAHGDGVRTVLSGFYGDDLYSGKNYWFADLLRGRRFSLAGRILAHHPAQFNPKHDLLDYGLRAIVPSQVKKWYRGLPFVTSEWAEWIHPQLAASTGLKQLGSEVHNHTKFSLPSQQHRYWALFFTGYPESATLMQDIAQQSGMEYRFPYMDRHIVEFVMGIPAEQIAAPGPSRRILREALAGKLPETVRQRTDKTVLMELTDRGIYQEGFSEIQDILLHSQVIERGFVRKDWLAGELGNQTRIRAGFILWLVLSLETWLQKYW